MDATGHNNAADAFIKVIYQSDPMALDFIDELFGTVQAVAGCTRDELPEIAIKTMAQAHKDNVECTNEAFKLAEASKNKVDKLKRENAVLSKEIGALKKIVEELEKVEDGEEWVKLSDEDME